jgi:membrane protein DedA with SNARE-associated domain
VLLLMFGIAGLPIPDETLLTFTGYLIYKHHLRLGPALAAAWIGSICGITLSYLLGRFLGLGIIHKYGRYLHITEERVRKAHDWFERIGRWALTFGYYIPGVRHFTAYAAGTSCLEMRVFAAFAYTGALLWSTSFIALGYVLGDKWETVLEQVHRHFLLATIAAAALLVTYWLVRRARARRK